MKLIAYHRVSTDRQGSSGLGLEAQERATSDYAARINGTIVEKFTEIESGKDNQRPELHKALHQSKITGSTLVIAKLDRLSRNATFLLTLRDSGVNFVAADMPDANNLTVGIMALIAQHERESISKRTKEALTSAKLRGKKLGNPNGAAALKRAAKGNSSAILTIKDKADSHATDIKPIVDTLIAKGVTTLQGIADHLNAKGILTPRGKRWHRSSVRNLRLRLTQ